MAKKETTQLKWKKKKWFKIQSPATFGTQIIGETSALDPNEIVGKTVKLNVMHLTKNPKKQNTTIKFKVTDVKEGVASSKTYSYNIIPSTMKRIIRSGRDRVDESFIIKSKDGFYGRIKPLITTSSRQPAALRTKMRRMCVSVLRKYAAEKNFEELVREIVDNKVQSMLREKLQTVTRLRNCEIRVLELIENFAKLKQKRLEKRQKKESVEEAEETTDDTK